MDGNTTHSETTGMTPMANTSELAAPVGQLNTITAEEPRLDLREIADILAAGRKTVAAALLLVLGLAVLYLMLAPRTYKADALVRVDKNKALLAAPLRSEGNRAATEAENPRAQREVEILRSRSVLGKVVEDLNLTVEAEPDYFPLIGRALARLHDTHDGLSKPWWGFARWAWGGEKLQVELFDVPDRYLDKTFTLVALAENEFMLLSPNGKPLAEGLVGDRIGADIGETAPVRIKVSSLEAHAGTHFSLSRKTSLSAIEKLQKAFSVREVSKDTDLLTVELKGADPERLAKSVNDIAGIYVNATVNWESAEASQKLAFLESQLPVVKQRLEKSEQSLSAYRQQHGAVDISAEAEILLKQASEMETLGIQLKQKYEEQSQRLEAAHPDMVATKAQIKRIDRKLAELEKRIKDLPRTQQNMVSLSRDVQVNTELYTSLLNNAQEQRIAAAGSLGNSRIVDYAVVPEKPYWPRPGLLLAIAGLLGLGLGASAVFLKHSLRRHDHYPFYLEGRVGLPLYAAIPHSPRQRRLVRSKDKGGSRDGEVLASSDPLDLSVESLRSFRTTLETVFAGHDGKVLMLSSPAPGMGKSFVSANLATLLASIRKRVLLIDADLRNGRLHETFAVPRQPGLSDYLAGRVALGEVIVSLPGVGVDLIPGGTTPANPAELLTLGDLPGMLAELKSFYNHIIIDSPPILGVTDAAIVGRHADATFLVVKEGRYTLQELEVSSRRFLQAGVKPNGFLMNDLKDDAAYYPYYGYPYRPAAGEGGTADGTGRRWLGGWLDKRRNGSVPYTQPLNAELVDGEAEIGI